MAPSRRVGAFRLGAVTTVGFLLVLASGTLAAAGDARDASTDLGRALAPTGQLSSAAASLVAGGGPVPQARWTCTSAGSTSDRCSADAVPSAAAPAGYVWTALTSKVNAGPDQTDVEMTYDTGDGYVLLFGGQNDLFQSQGYTWTYALGAWTNITGQVTGTPPPGVVGDSLAYSAPAGGVVLFGGITTSGAYSHFTYLYHDLVWSNLSSTAGTPPSARAYAAFSFDTYDGELVLFGGEVAGGIATWVADTWVFEQGVWVNISSASPHLPPMIDGAILTDYLGHGALLFGDAVWGTTLVPSTYLFANGAFHNLTGTTPAPPGLYYGGGAYVAAVGGVVVYGGYTLVSGADVASPQTWLYSGGTWTNVSLAVAPNGGPTDDLGGTAYNPQDGTILSYGGMGTRPADTQYTWALAGPPAPTASASPRVTDVGLGVAFTGGGAPGLSPSTARWTFGDGSSSTTSVVTHTYSAAGLVVANYTVSSFSGVNTTVALALYVNPAPTASILIVPSAPVVGGPLVVAPIASGGLAPYTYAWSFGDGGTSDAVAPAHAYATSGTYTVSLNVTDSLGGIAHATESVTVASAPAGSPTSVNPVSGVGLYLLGGLVAAVLVAALLGALVLRKPRAPIPPVSP